MEGDLWERKVLVTGLDFSYILRLVFSLCRGGMVQGSQPLIASLIIWGASLIAQLVKNLPAMQETSV